MQCAILSIGRCPEEINMRIWLWMLVIGVLSKNGVGTDFKVEVDNH